MTAVRSEDEQYKEDLLRRVFSEPEDRRIEFFINKFSSRDLYILMELRRRLLNGAEIEKIALDQYKFIFSEQFFFDEEFHRYLFCVAKEVPVLDTLLDLVINSELSVDGRILWSYSSDDQELKIPLLSGCGIPAVISSLGAAAYVYFFRLMDPESFGGGVDPQEKFMILNAAYLMVLGISGLVYYISHAKGQFEYMLEKLDSPEHDALLDSVLNGVDGGGEGEPAVSDEINWSEIVDVMGVKSSLRKFCLTLLLCFDDRMYETFLPSLIDRIKLGVADIDLVAPGGKEIKIHRDSLDHGCTAVCSRYCL